MLSLEASHSCITAGAEVRCWTWTYPIFITYILIILYYGLWNFFGGLLGYSLNRFSCFGTIGLCSGFLVDATHIFLYLSYYLIIIIVISHMTIINFWILSSIYAIKLKIYTILIINTLIFVSSFQFFSSIFFSQMLDYHFGNKMKNHRQHQVLTPILSQWYLKESEETLISTFMLTLYICL